MAMYDRWLERLVDGKRHCWGRCVAKQCRHALAREFQRWIGDWNVVRPFPTRLPLEDRSERDAPVGVLVGRNEGRRKKLPAEGCSDGGYGFCEAV